MDQKERSALYTGCIKLNHLHGRANFRKLLKLLTKTQSKKILKCLSEPFVNKNFNKVKDIVRNLVRFIVTEAE